MKVFTPHLTAVMLLNSSYCNHSLNFKNIFDQHPQLNILNIVENPAFDESLLAYFQQ